MKKIIFFVILSLSLFSAQQRSTKLTFSEFMNIFNSKGYYDNQIIYIVHINSKAEIEYTFTKNMLLTEHYLLEINYLQYQYIYYIIDDDGITISYEWFEHFMTVDNDNKYEMIDQILNVYINNNTN